MSVKVSHCLKWETASCIGSVTLDLSICSISCYLLLCFLSVTRWELMQLAHWEATAPGGELTAKQTHSFHLLRSRRKLLNEDTDLPKVAFLSSLVLGLWPLILTQDASVCTGPAVMCLYFKLGVKYSTSICVIHMTYWFPESQNNFNRELESQKLSDASLGRLTYSA